MILDAAKHNIIGILDFVQPYKDWKQPWCSKNIHAFMLRIVGMLKLHYMDFSVARIVFPLFLG